MLCVIVVRKVSEELYRKMDLIKAEISMFVPNLEMSNVIFSNGVTNPLHLDSLPTIMVVTLRDLEMEPIMMTRRLIVIVDYPQPGELFRRKDLIRYKNTPKSFMI